MTDPLDAWYAAIRSGDSEALAAATTEDVTLLWNGDPSRIPWAGLHDGRAAVARFFATVAEHLEVLDITRLDRVEAEGTVVVLLAARWRVRANGREVASRAVNLFRLHGPRVAAYEVYNDTAVFERALAP